MKLRYKLLLKELFCVWILQSKNMKGKNADFKNQRGEAILFSLIIKLSIKKIQEKWREKRKMSFRLYFAMMRINFKRNDEHKEDVAWTIVKNEMSLLSYTIQNNPFLCSCFLWTVLSFKFWLRQVVFFSRSLSTFTKTSRKVFNIFEEAHKLFEISVLSIELD